MFITVPIIVAITTVWGAGNIHESCKHNADAIPCVNFVDDRAYFHLKEDSNCEDDSPSSCSNPSLS
jgi:hypothetical protein